MILCKKILAREFLLLIITVALAAVSYFGTFAYNYYWTSKSKNISADIWKKLNERDSLRLPAFRKMSNKKDFINKVAEHYETVYDSANKVWIRLDNLAKQDSIKYRWKLWDSNILQFFHQTDLKTPEEIKAFFDTNRLTKFDLENYEKSKEADRVFNDLEFSRNNCKRNILTYEQQKHFGVYSLFTIIILIFVSRYLIYSIKWCMKILKQKSA